MKPHFEFSDAQRDELCASFQHVQAHPYQTYQAFDEAIAHLAQSDFVPGYLRQLCEGIRMDRLSGRADIHLLRNCPVDMDVPELDHDDPVADKHRKKKTFVGEIFLALMSRLLETPLMAYGTRHGGAFFTDVVAINKYSGLQTGFSDSELVYHNDRTAHAVRADFISLLGLRCPTDDLIYTGFIGGRDLLNAIAEVHHAELRKPQFLTPFDVYSRDTNERQVVSDIHPILERAHSFRYLDSITQVAPGAGIAARDALLAMKDAVTRAAKTRHRILKGDLLTFANQDGLHNREKVDVLDPDSARTRWLLKTYAFRDRPAAERHADKWLDGVYGRVAD